MSKLGSAIVIFLTVESQMHGLKVPPFEFKSLVFYFVNVT